MSEILTSRKNSKVIELAKIAKEGKPNCFVVEGFHSVDMALSSGAAKEIFSTKPYPNSLVKQTLVSQEVMEKICTSKNPEGIIALCALNSSLQERCNRVLLLDRVQDPGNLGTLLRSALAFGFKRVITSFGNCSVFNSKAIQSSQGAIFQLKIEESKKDAKAIIEQLKEEGYFVIGSALEKAEAFETFERKEEKIAIVLGNEGKGIQKEALKITDVNLKIAISEIDSLNVGVAGGIFMHAFRAID